MRSAGITIQTVPAIPDIEPGDDLAAIIVDRLTNAELAVQDGDILAVAQKVVSKAAGRYVCLDDIIPGQRALELAATLGKDPRKVEVVLRESRRVIRAKRHPHRSEGVLITEHRLGFICANAAIDESNISRSGSVLLLPEAPDASARALRAAIKARTGADVGVVITDSFGRPWRLGLVNVAIGLAGPPALLDLTGSRDAFGRMLSATVPALADEIAAASGLAMAKNAKTPVVLFQGIDWQPASDSAQTLLRPTHEDLFL